MTAAVRMLMWGGQKISNVLVDHVLGQATEQSGAGRRPESEVCCCKAGVRVPVQATK